MCVASVNFCEYEYMNAVSARCQCQFRYWCIHNYLLKTHFNVNARTRQSDAHLSAHVATGHIREDRLQHDLD